MGMEQGSLNYACLMLNQQHQLKGQEQRSEQLPKESEGRLIARANASPDMTCYGRQAGSPEPAPVLEWGACYTQMSSLLYTGSCRRNTGLAGFMQKRLCSTLLPSPASALLLPGAMLQATTNSSHMLCAFTCIAIAACSHLCSPYYCHAAQSRLQQSLQQDAALRLQCSLTKSCLCQAPQQAVPDSRSAVLI